MSDTISTIHGRISAQHFDSSKQLSADEIRALVQEATEAPSSFNIQHWRFIAVTDPAKKQALTAASYGQAKVSESAVTFIILGDLEGHTKLQGILNQSVDAGLLPREVAEQWVQMADSMYGSSAAFARDEAIRSASLAAMTLMLAAKVRGLVSGPMIGFDPAQVKQLFGIADQYIPVMLLPVGYPGQGNTSRKPRLRVDEVLSFNESRQF
ncbi:MAG: nitroreductase family protein [Nostoc sp.]|uniref:nitroreductase family protein n=1 Tax=Nostoc sp. TaxID=1180 RepID=UPI002FF774F7